MEALAVIKDSELAAQIRQSLEFFQKITEKYQRGLLCAQERDRCFRAELWQGFQGFLHNRGLHLRVREETWQAFQGDYRRWKTRPQFFTASEAAWLSCGTASASSSDKRAVLQLMEAFQLSAAYFAPPPMGCTQPDIRLSAYGTGMAGLIRFLPVQDGGLFRQTDPVGKEYTLRDARGLKAVLRIEASIPERERQSNNRLTPYYSAQGSVEGYTTPRKRKILVSLPETDGVVALDLDLDGEDLRLFYSFPLWADYHAWEQSVREREAEHLTRLERFCEETAKAGTAQFSQDESGVQKTGTAYTLSSPADPTPFWDSTECFGSDHR